MIYWRRIPMEGKNMSKNEFIKKFHNFVSNSRSYNDYKDLKGINDEL